MVKARITKPGYGLLRTLGFTGKQRRTRGCDPANPRIFVALSNSFAYNFVVEEIYFPGNKNALIRRLEKFNKIEDKLKKNLTFESSPISYFLLKVIIHTQK